MNPENTASTFVAILLNPINMNTPLKFRNNISALILFLAMSLGSCTMEKRLYTSGIHLEWNGKKHPSSSTAGKHTTQNHSPGTAIASAAHDSVLQPGSLPPNAEPLTASADQRPFLSNKRTIPDKPGGIAEHKKASTPIKAKPRQLSKKRETEPKTIPLQPEDDLKKQKNLLSTLWTFVSLNYLYCDLVGLMDATKLSQYLVGTVDGLVMSQGFLLAAAIFIEIPMIMILLSRVLKGKGNRHANIIAGILMTVVQLATLFLGPVSMYYLFFSIIEIATTAFIVWYAWKKFPKTEKV